MLASLDGFFDCCILQEVSDIMTLTNMTTQQDTQSGVSGFGL